MFMAKPANWRYLPLILCLQVTSLVAAEIWDAERERAVADKMQGSLDVGEVIWLKHDGGYEFPGIYAPGGTDHPETAVILLHGMGGHPDWPDVISPLRKSLTGLGWSTFSLQMPVLLIEAPIADYGKTLKEAERRIHTAVGYLKAAGYLRIVLLGYGFGAATGVYYLARHDTQEITGLVMISILARKYLEPPLNLNTYLRQIKRPILDIYAEHDLQTITGTADDRRLAGRQNTEQYYRQVKIAGADHYYTEQGTALMQNIDQWLLNPHQSGQTMAETPEQATAQTVTEAD